MRRNCSITPRQLAVAFSALSCMSFLVAIYFLLHGIWYVIGFTVIELAAVGASFIIFARHVTDRETVRLSDDCLFVELVQVDQVRQFRLDPRSTRVEPPSKRNGLVALEENGTRIELGRFLTEWKRREFAKELRIALASLRNKTEFQS
ncbi:DUF2244 domain-containing protein [Noviherbaspirillum galbum]|nr:DUF2244 domain-containing protein [Noviherbaspirillum galbum]